MKIANINMQEGAGESCCKSNRQFSYFRLPLRIQMYATFFSILFATLGLVSCSTPSRNLSFSNSNEAIEECRAFLKELKEKDKPEINSFISDMKYWGQLSDSAICCIRKDTVQKPHYFPMSSFSHLDDSIRTELTRLALSKERSYTDVLQLKIELSAYAEDTSIIAAKSEAEPFFNALEKQAAFKDDKQLIAKYQQFLSRTLKNGIRKKAELMDFIKEEDCFFKGFLSNMHKLSSHSLSEITHSTEEVCALIYQNSGTPELTSKDAVIYMAMRTNQRLLLNAQVCIKDVKGGRAKQATQYSAYIWMVSQPFVLIDDFGLALLTESQMATFKHVAQDAQPTINKLNARLNTKEKSAFVPLLLKLYISNY